jgi:manganese/iron transport system permease protein/iron/zinc/copper transport system permease protein
MFEPFQYEFFVRGIIAATVVGGLCGLVGVYVVLRRMSYIGHGLSHSIFGGAVVAYVMSFNFYIGASIWGFLSAVLINLTTRQRRFIAADAAIGIITTASFALGIALISRYRTFTRSFDAALFGNILGVTQNDLYAIYAVTALTFIAIMFFYRRLLFTTFDPEVAPYFGVSTAWVDTFFSLVLAGAIVVSLQVLGATLIAATLVIPPITARLLTDNFSRMMALSVLIGSSCGFAGIYISYYVDISSGASIVLTSAGVFLLAMAWSVVRNHLATLRGLSARAGATAHERAQAAELRDVDVH